MERSFFQQKESVWLCKIPSRPAKPISKEQFFPQAITHIFNHHFLDIQGLIADPQP